MNITSKGIGLFNGKPRKREYQQIKERHDWGRDSPWLSATECPHCPVDLPKRANNMVATEIAAKPAASREGLRFTQH
jgi:hypothetical protein